LSFLTTFVGTVKNGQVFLFKVRSRFNGHRSTYIIIRLFNFVVAETKRFEQIPFKIEVLLRLKAKALQTFFSKGIDIKYKTDLKGRTNGGIEFFDFFCNESFFTKALVIDIWSSGKCSGTH